MKQNKKIKDEMEIYRKIPSLIKNDKSPLGQLILQENLISIKITFLLISVNSFLTRSTLKQFETINKLDTNCIPAIVINYKKHTLGDLKRKLETYFSMTEKDLILDITNYINERNTITHNIVSLGDEKLIYKKSQELIILGEAIIKNIDRLAQAATLNDGIMTFGEEYSTYKQ